MAIRKSKYAYIDNVSLFRMRPMTLAWCLQIPIRTVYTLRNNRLRHGKVPEVMHDLLTMTDFDFLCRYGMRKHEIRKERKNNEKTIVRESSQTKSRP
jgi:hypothetical protein